MANTVAPFGLAPLIGRTTEGGFLSTRFLPALTATAFYIGDAVTRAAGGGLSRTITPGTTNYSGVCLQQKAAGVAAPTAAGLPVCDQITQLYRVQDDSTAVMGVAAKGLNANLIITGIARRGPTVSGDLLAATTAAVGANLDMHVVDAWGDPQTDPALAGAIWVVTFNKHRMATGIAGV